MADPTVTQGDTYPPLRGLASDSRGPVDLTTAANLTVILKSPGTTVRGTATVVWPVQTDEDGNDYNWEYVWAAGDTDTPGDYEAQLKVTWDEGSTPPKVEYFPNGQNPTLKIKAALG